MTAIHTKLNVIGLVSAILAFISVALPWWAVSRVSIDSGPSFTVLVNLWGITDISTQIGIPLTIENSYILAALALVVCSGILGLLGSLWIRKTEKILLRIAGISIILSAIIFAVGISLDLSKHSWWLFYSNMMKGTNFSAYLSFGFFLAIVASILMLISTTSVAKLSLHAALKTDYIKTAILIVIAISGMLSFWFGIRAVLRTEYPFMAVATPSMVPTLPVGTLIAVQGYTDPSTIYVSPKTAPSPGDIVVFWHWDEFRGYEHWVHRAIGEKIVSGKRYLITQGDANSGPDIHHNLTTNAALDGLPEKYVIGKVVAAAPFIGQVALFMQTGEGRMLIIALIAALLIVEFIPFSRKKDEEQEPAQEQVEA